MGTAQDFVLRIRFSYDSTGCWSTCRWCVFTLTDHAVVHVSPLSVSQNGSVELCSPMATEVNRF